MWNPGTRAIFVTFALSFIGCGSADEEGVEPESSQPPTLDPSIDQRSYRLGSIGAFAEMVGAGVNQLALSAPLVPAEMDALISEARRIVSDHGVGAFLETDFLVTDLFPEELTEGKQVLLICQEDTYRTYQELKRRKQELLDAGQYEGESRIEIARQFGALLSYSEEKTEALLETGAAGR